MTKITKKLNQTDLLYDLGTYMILWFIAKEYLASFTEDTLASKKT